VYVCIEYFLKTWKQIKKKSFVLVFFEILYVIILNLARLPTYCAYAYGVAAAGATRGGALAIDKSVERALVIVPFPRIFRS